MGRDLMWYKLMQNCIRMMYAMKFENRLFDWTNSLNLFLLPRDISLTELSTGLYDSLVLIWTRTCKPLTNSLVENETTVSIVRITFSESLIDGAQVQVDSIIQVDSTVYLQVDSII